ncbi:MAG: NTP transferase domain-containing protein [Tepidisphaerales bacterium]
MQTVPVYILAGGRSSRFGSDKARALLAGRPLIAHVAEQARPCASCITVVADQVGKYDDLGLRTICDLDPGNGPVGGLQTALHDCSAPGWLAVVPCDLAGLKTAWITSLLARCADGPVAIALKGDRWEPLLALYHTSLRDRVDRRVAAGLLAMHNLLDDHNAIAVPLPSGWPAVCQVNTRDDLDKLSAMSAPELTVLLFGLLAQKAGTRQIRVRVPGGSTTCAELRQALAAAEPRLAPLLPVCRFAVNQAFVAEGRVLKNTDEIALIGMVSGG